MKVVYGFFFIVISIYPAYVQSTLQTAVRDFGDSIEITCSVYNVNTFPIAWFKFEKEDPTKTTILSISNKLMVRNSRFSLRIHVENGTNNHILKIQDIRNTDIALYRCLVMCDDVDDEGNTSADVELEVNRPPVILDSSSPTLVNAREGLSSRLECNADGFPEPRVTWTRQNNGIITNGGNFYRGNVLRFPNVTKDDRGLYFCDAVNGVGGAVRRIIDFRVHFSPVITVSKIMYTHRDPSKLNMDVQCLVEAYPAPKIEWLYNGAVLPKDKHDYEVIENATVNEFAFSTLSFLKINNERIGKYTCKAQNTIGTAEVTAIEHHDPEQDKRGVHQQKIPNFYGLSFFKVDPGAH